MRNKLFIMIYLLLITNRAYTAFEQSLTGGTRIFGMAGAGVGYADAGENASLNPAGLGFVRYRIHIATMYSPVLVGLDNGNLYNLFFNVSSSVKNIGGFALNWKYFGVNVDEKKNIYSENTGILSFGRQIGAKWSVGCNIKYYSWDSAATEDFFGNKETLQSKDVSFDIAGLYRNRSNLSVGLVIMDFTQPFVSSTSAKNDYREELPLQIRLGLSFEAVSTLFVIDSEYVNRQVNFKFGAEHWFWKDRIGARMGFQLWNIVLGINGTAGLSFRINPRFIIDYGFLYPLTSIRGTYGTHRIGLIFQM